MSENKTEGKRVGIVLPEEVYAQGKEAAKRERRSFSNYVVTLIDRATGAKPQQEPEAAADKKEAA